MKIILTFILFLSMYLPSLAQTPSFSFKFRLEELMSHGIDSESTYTIDMEKCEFREEKIDYSHDTSDIDWNNLPDILHYKSVGILTRKSYVLDFNLRNHDYVFENIFIINIYREKGGEYDTMKISLPIKMKSFVTFIDFGKIYFVPGYYNLADKLIYFIDESSYLQITIQENALPK